MKSFSSDRCSFCGKAHSTDFSGGQWDGPHETVYCCGVCATKVLPLLIADSIRSRGDHYLTAVRALELVESTFWKAIAARASHAAGELACKLAELAEKQARSERGAK